MKIEAQGTITDKQGYEAMLHFLNSWYALSKSTDLTDILSGGEYGSEDTVSEGAFWQYWLAAIEKVKRDGPLLKKFK